MNHVAVFALDLVLALLVAPVGIPTASALSFQPAAYPRGPRYVEAAHALGRTSAILLTRVAGIGFAITSFAALTPRQRKENPK